jgi:hypothetical protein
MAWLILFCISLKKLLLSILLPFWVLKHRKCAYVGGLPQVGAIELELALMLQRQVAVICH